jgi:hypothetical protein
MRMTEEEWFEFVSFGKPPIVSVTRLPAELCRVIDCSSTLVRYQHDYALKSAQKHNFRAAHFPMLPILIDVGFVIQDRPRCLTFYWYENVVFGGWLGATVKANESATELWVSTFHPANPKEIKRMKKKYRIIRQEKL